MTGQQSTLVEIAEQPEREAKPDGGGALKLERVNRQQTMLVQIVVEDLIGPEHKARAVWDLSGQLDLSGFEAALKTREGKAGRAAWEPRLLVSLWVYAYSEAISSARELERCLEWEPGLQWLSGLQVVNHHTLSDFRVDHQEALNELFAQLLAVLEGGGWVKLDRLMQDGTKIRAQAGGDSFRREATVRERLSRAREVVKEMGDPLQEGASRQRAAQQRAARERVERLAQALQELQEMPQKEAPAERRVSLSEPKARVMKHGDGGFAPSYNAQISTDAEQKIIVSAYLTQHASDSGELAASLEAVVKERGVKPRQVVADGGYTTRESVVEMARQEIDFIGSLGDKKARERAAMKQAGIDPAFGPSAFLVLGEQQEALQCPPGRRLEHVRQSRKDGVLYQQYQAAASDCGACPLQPKCCPHSAVRTVSIRQEKPEVVAFAQKMATVEARQIYRQRGAVAEFPHAWLKEKIGLRKFRLRGLAKASLELQWACLTYNVMQWFRLQWRPGLLSAATA